MTTIAWRILEEPTARLGKLARTKLKQIYK